MRNKEFLEQVFIEILDDTALEVDQESDQRNLNLQDRLDMAYETPNGALCMLDFLRKENSADNSR